VRPHRADDREKIGAGFDKGPAIFLRDAADRAARHDRRFAPVAQQFGVGAVFRAGFGRAREERAKGDVVGAGFSGDQRAMAARAAGHANDPVGAEQPPRLGIGRVLFADMDAVAIEFGGEVWAVVHDERDAAVLRDRLQYPRRTPDDVVVNIFEPQLEGGDIAAGEGFRQLSCKQVGVEGGRRDQIQTRRRPRRFVRQGSVFALIDLDDLVDRLGEFHRLFLLAKGVDAVTNPRHCLLSQKTVSGEDLGAC
jgi:hypothetical protein